MEPRKEWQFVFKRHPILWFMLSKKTASVRAFEEGKLV